MLLKDLKTFIASMPGAGESGPVRICLIDASGISTMYEVADAICSSNAHDGLTIHANDPRPNPRFAKFRDTDDYGNPFQRIEGP